MTSVPPTQPPTQPPAAPDPTTGEGCRATSPAADWVPGVWADHEHLCVTHARDEHECACGARWEIDPASLPAFAASTGTSEDVEALEDLIALHDAYRVNEDGWTVCICGHVAVGDDDDGSHARHLTVVLAAREAATADRVRREGAALVRDDIRARRREFRRLNADQQYLNALDDAYGLAANRAREGR